MDYVINYKEGVDNFYDSYWQELRDSLNGDQLYYVYDLTDCPEDAVIGRDLFSAYDWIDAVRFGMKLAELGYDKIVINNVTEEQE